MSYKPTICVDFDGVIHSYTSGWVDAQTVLDPPVPGAFPWLCQLVEAEFEVCIYSSRSKEEGGIEAMKSWLRKHGLRSDVLLKLHFPALKPAAVMTVDDRAFCFEGWFPTPEWIREFKPWNRHRQSGSVVSRARVLETVDMWAQSRGVDVQELLYRLRTMSSVDRSELVNGKRS